MTTATATQHPPSSSALEADAPSGGSVPANANEGCVGPQSSTAGQASSCEGCPNQGACASGAFNSPEALRRDEAESAALRNCLKCVSHVVLVLSGKGGVGKSTVASQLAHVLSSRGYAVGLLDVDLCGPSAPRMVLGDAHSLATVRNHGGGNSGGGNGGEAWWTPVYARDNLAVMSIGFLLQDPDQAVVWRGPRKNQLIQQFLTQVDWSGDTDGLDYLIVDTPPGTSDEHISTVQYLQKAGAVSGAVVVTTPEEVSLADVRKELSFCRKTKVPVLGVVENMSAFQTRLDQLQYTDSAGNDCTSRVLEALRASCPEVLQCTAHARLFDSDNGDGACNGSHTTTTTPGGAEAMAHDHGDPFWGRLPLDPGLLRACERGLCYADLSPDAPASCALQHFANLLVQQLPVAMAGDASGGAVSRS